MEIVEWNVKKREEEKRLKKAKKLVKKRVSPIRPVDEKNEESLRRRKELRKL